MEKTAWATSKVDTLTKGKSAEIASRIKSLQKQGAKGFVLDLRNNGEGDESERASRPPTCSLNHGTITYLQGQKYPREAFHGLTRREGRYHAAGGGAGGIAERQARRKSWRRQFLRTRAATWSATRPSATDRCRS